MERRVAGDDSSVSFGGSSREEEVVTEYPGHSEIRKVTTEEEANALLAHGWSLFTVVSGGGEHVHYILTRRA
jgi:hypothetical protein